MSKRIEATITCPEYNHQFQATLFRAIWGEYSENRQLVFNYIINTVDCPICNKLTKLPYPFMYVEINKQFAVWWEPYHDEQIDKVAAEYAKLFGPGNFYAAAPRIAEWEEFKSTIKQFETGELKAHPIKVSTEQKQQFQLMMENLVKDLEKSKKKSSNSGCMLSFDFIVVVGFAILYIITI